MRKNSWKSVVVLMSLCLLGGGLKESPVFGCRVWAKPSFEEEESEFGPGGEGGQMSGADQPPAPAPAPQGNPASQSAPASKETASAQRAAPRSRRETGQREDPSSEEAAAGKPENTQDPEKTEDTEDKQDPEKTEDTQKSPAFSFPQISGNDTGAAEDPSPESVSENGTSAGTGPREDPKATGDESEDADPQNREADPDPDPESFGEETGAEAEEQRSLPGGIPAVIPGAGFVLIAAGVVRAVLIYRKNKTEE